MKAMTANGVSPAPTDETKQSNTAIVIGAGLAGANIAERLAARGWKVQAIESHDAPARGASGNPAGIVMPLLTRDDALAARFSRACYLYLLTRLAELPECQWSACGVLQIARDHTHESLQSATLNTLELPEDFAEFLSRDQAEKLVGQPLSHGGWWFPRGGWLVPASLCTALLSRFQNRIHCQFNTTVTRLSHDGDCWSAYAGDKQCIATARHLVLANAQCANDLLDHRLPLQIVRGQINYLPVNEVPSVRLVLCRNGYLTPAHEGYVTYGASFVNDDTDLALRDSECVSNLQRLKEILPQFEFSAGATGNYAMLGRVAVRTVSPDRLPMVGAVPATAAKSARLATLSDLPRRPNLHTLLGLSARGIVWAPLAAEHLACLMNGEPSPLSAEIAAAIDVGRFMVKAMRRT